MFAGAIRSSGILCGAVIFSILMSFGSYWWNDKIVLAMSGAKEVTRESGRSIDCRESASRASTEKITLSKTLLNAFATGRDAKHGVICLYDGHHQPTSKNRARGCDCA